MKFYFLKVSAAVEKRVPLLPQECSKLIALGCEVWIESGLGENIHIEDREYTGFGAQVFKEPLEAYREQGIFIRIRGFQGADSMPLKSGSVLIGLLNPFSSRDSITALAEKGISAISLEMMPRITRAQNMDVLSSQASLAGYSAVILGTGRLMKVLPMMTTPAGTIKPSRVLVIGAGVAGLQAIATARRLGARVEAYDIRTEAAEQVRSLGARFISAETIAGDVSGYAGELTEQELASKREKLAGAIAEADLVITAAQVFGKKAPVMVTRDMINRMRPGSVIVDLASETGGNVEKDGNEGEMEINRVTILSPMDLSGRVSYDASAMFSSNIYNFISEFFDKDKKDFLLDESNEIMKGCLVTYKGEIVSDMLKKHYKENTE